MLVETQTLIIIGLVEGKKGGAKMIQKTVGLNKSKPNRKPFRSLLIVYKKFNSSSVRLNVLELSYKVNSKRLVCHLGNKKGRNYTIFY